MVDGAPGCEPQAGDVSLSDLWSFLARPRRAYADRARRRYSPAPPRPHGLRDEGPCARAAGAQRRVAAHPASPSLLVATAAASRLAPRGVHVLGLHTDDHALFPGLAEGIDVLVQVLLGERVDVLVGALARALGDTAADLHVLVGVLEVLHGERDPWITLEVAHPAAPLGAVDYGVTVLDIDPYGDAVHGAVGTQRGDVAEVLRLQQLLGSAIDSCAHQSKPFLVGVVVSIPT